MDDALAFLDHLATRVTASALTGLGSGAAPPGRAVLAYVAGRQRKGQASAAVLSWAASGGYSAG